MTFHTGIGTLLISLLAGCGAPPAQESQDPSATSTLSPIATNAPTASPTPDPTGGDQLWRSVDGLAVTSGGLAEVIVTDLVMRSAPRIADDSEILPVGLSSGDIVFVADGPVAASNYQWYFVQAVITHTFGRNGPAGWVAASSRDGMAWMHAVEPICPDAPVTVPQLLGVASPLACYGGRTLSFRLDTGELFCGSGGPGSNISPAWFSEQTGCGFSDAEPGGAHAFRFPPGVDDPWHGSETPPPTPPFQVNGHFDDPAARDCVQSPDAPLPLTPDEVALACRMEFVVEGIID
jgi:hypothetical protein